jgi:CRP-like cAMP-binding protein
MSLAAEPATPLRNRLLARLPGEEHARLLPHLEKVSLPYRQILYEPGAAISHVYFPEGGVFSLITPMASSPSVEMATIGNEGMVGLPVFLGADRMPSGAITQISGEALRMSAETFKQQVKRDSPLHDLLQRYTLALFNLVAQSAACNRVHSIEERCGRWLLMTHDRVEADEFSLTQDFLAQMLGVRRPSVSLVASTLQRAGLIRYRRGRITILDRQGLEAAACECYRVIRDEFDRLLG